MCAGRQSTSWPSPLTRSGNLVVKVPKNTHCLNICKRSLKRFFIQVRSTSYPVAGPFDGCTNCCRICNSIVRIYASMFITRSCKHPNIFIEKKRIFGSKSGFLGPKKIALFYSNHVFFGVFYLCGKKRIFGPLSAFRQNVKASVFLVTRIVPTSFVERGPKLRVLI